MSRLTRHYPGSPPVVAVDAVDLTIRQGEYVALSGPSGCGKSTLVNLLSLLDRPDDGSYLLTGLETIRLKDAERSALRARYVGVVFQECHLLPYRSAVENVAMAHLYRGTPRRERLCLARDALEAVGLAARVDALPATLSGGQRQRVAIARALASDPAFLLCDEPTGNLDSAATAALLDILDNLNAGGLTILVITHDQEVATRATRQLSMCDGRLSEPCVPDGRATGPVGAFNRATRQ